MKLLQAGQSLWSDAIIAQVTFTHPRTVYTYALEGPLAPQFNKQSKNPRSRISTQYVAISMRAMGINAHSAPANLLIFVLSAMDLTHNPNATERIFLCPNTLAKMVPRDNQSDGPPQARDIIN